MKRRDRNCSEELNIYRFETDCIESEHRIQIESGRKIYTRFIAQKHQYNKYGSEYMVINGFKLVEGGGIKGLFLEKALHIKINIEIH